MKIFANNVSRPRFLSRQVSLIACFLIALILPSLSYSADLPVLQSIKWKSESNVESMLGAPNSIRGPIGTHASYTLWMYDDYSVAFSNGRAFHLFDKNSLKIQLEENR